MPQLVPLNMFVSISKFWGWAGRLGNILTYQNNAQKQLVFGFCGVLSTTIFSSPPHCCVLYFPNSPPQILHDDSTTVILLLLLLLFVWKERAECRSPLLHPHNWRLKIITGPLSSLLSSSSTEWRLWAELEEPRTKLCYRKREIDWARKKKLGKIMFIAEICATQR